MARADLDWGKDTGWAGNKEEKSSQVLARAWLATSMRFIHLGASRTNLGAF